MSTLEGIAPSPGSTADSLCARIGHCPHEGTAVGSFICCRCGKDLTFWTLRWHSWAWDGSLDGNLSTPTDGVVVVRVDSEEAVK